jgi:hypothetical protein
MIDNFSILLSHALLALAFWILASRPELDSEEPPPPDAEPEGFAVKRPGQYCETTPDA